MSSSLESMMEAIEEQNVAIKIFESEWENLKSKLEAIQDYKKNLINRKMELKQVCIIYY